MSQAHPSSNSVANAVLLLTSIFPMNHADFTACLVPFSPSRRLFHPLARAASDAHVPARTLLRDLILIDAIPHHCNHAWELCSRPALTCRGRVCYRSCVVPGRRGGNPLEPAAASRGGWRLLLGCGRGRRAGRFCVWHADLRRHPHRREHERARPSGHHAVHPLGGGGRGAA